MSRLVGLALVLMLSACGETGVVPAAPVAAPVTTLRAIPAAHGLRVGERRAMRVVVEDSAELVSDITANAKIDNVAVAGLEDGAVVGVAPGTTTMHVTDADGANVDVPIVVTDAEPVSLAIDVPPGAPRVGERVQVRAAVSYADGTIADVTLDTDWMTTTKARLVVPNTMVTRGAVVAIMPKPGTLIAHFGELEARTEIAPTGGEPSGIHVKLAWSYGKRRRFGAFAYWSDGETREVSAGCLWRVPGEAPFRGIDHAQHGPYLETTALAWNRVATCELGTTSGSGALFAE